MADRWPLLIAIISQAVSCISLNHSWVLYSQLCIYIYIYIKTQTSTASVGAAVGRSSSPAHSLYAAVLEVQEKVQYKVLWIFKKNTKKAQSLDAHHSCRFFFVCFFCFVKTIRVRGVRWLAQGLTINRPMESSQWQCGKVQYASCHAWHLFGHWLCPRLELSNRPTRHRMSKFWHG